MNLKGLHPGCLPAEGENGGLLGDMSPSKGISEADLGENETVVGLAQRQARVVGQFSKRDFCMF